MFLNILKLRTDARAPEQAKLDDKLMHYFWDPAGYDLYCPEQGVIASKQQKIIGLGFAAEFDKGYVGLICDRGGVGSKGVTKFGGVIDSDYRGEWMVTLYNSSEKPWFYGPEKAISQVLFFKFEQPTVAIVGKLSLSGREAGKFGSTDKKVFDEHLTMVAKADVKEN